MVSTHASVLCIAVMIYLTHTLHNLAAEVDHPPEDMCIAEIGMLYYRVYYHMCSQNDLQANHS